MILFDSALSVKQLSVKDSGTVLSVDQPDFATRDVRTFSFSELALLAIVLMIFFKFFIIDMFRKNLFRG